MKCLAAAVLATSLLCTAPFARAVMIDFGLTQNTPFSPTETYIEDNFQFMVVSGNSWAISANGNPPTALVAQGCCAQLAIGDTISIMQGGGGLFTFAALDFATSSFTNNQSVGVDLIGLVNGIQTQVFSNLNGNNNINNFQTLNPMFLAPIDELRIVGASHAFNSLIMDNFVFNPVAATVPETGSTVVLMFGALAALVVWRRLLPAPS